MIFPSRVASNSARSHPRWPRERECALVAVIISWGPTDSERLLLLGGHAQLCGEIGWCIEKCVSPVATAMSLLRAQRKSRRTAVVDADGAQKGVANMLGDGANH
eukprot:7126833-Pyramimonas_sp.AAC.1